MRPEDGAGGRNGASDPRDKRRPMPPSIQPGGAKPRAQQQRPETGHTPQRRSTRPAGAPAPQSGRQPQSPSGQQAQSGRPPQPRSAPRPAQAHTPASAPVEQPRRAPVRRKRHRLRNTLVFLLVLLLVAAIGLYFWVDSQIQSVDALSGAADTPGSTYLIVGSDSREGWDGGNDTPGQRTDTIMVLHKPESGPTALISIPRDSYVEIPGNGSNKINASFAFGGAPLLVETVEGLSGLTVDHYLEVGFGGVEGLVDAVGGVELCYDEDVSDRRSRLEWEAGCHVADGQTALAFARMRYSDPLGDIGRVQRQQQVVGAVVDNVLSPSTVLNPFTAMPVASAGLDAFRVSEGTSPFDLAGFALAFNSSRGGEAVTGTPPIASMGHDVAGVGSTVLLDPDTIDQFWDDIAAGAFEPGTEVGGV
ncbi:LCP family protein [Demequina sp. SO4-13]|uniref:LCP family protein n=1 Tax=Demequina sp. SO4-13 TaxID=3401027 RepID=UPI003AF94156